MPSCLFSKSRTTSKRIHVILNGSSRCGLPVNRAMALANAGASGGRPGSPMPVGASALGTMWTPNSGTSVIRGTETEVALLYAAVLQRYCRAGQTHRQAHHRRALDLRLDTARVHRQVAMHACRHAMQHRSPILDRGFHAVRSRSIA